MTNPHTNQKFVSRLWIFIVLVGIVVVVFGFISKKVRTVLGPADPSLTTTQRISYSFRLFTNLDNLTLPISEMDDEAIFDIQPGESVQMICLHLEQSGLIPDASTMRLYLVYSGLDRQMQSGSFLLKASLTPIEIASKISNRYNTTVNFSILPGWRIEEISESLATSGLNIGKQEFLSSAMNPPEELANLFGLAENQTLEGYLGSGAYVLSRETSVEDLLREALVRFSSSFNQELIDAFAVQGLEVREAIILASIVQREAMHDDEFPMIASVFINRLAVGMHLETDPTVQYALGFNEALNTWWKSPLSYADLEVDSHYNTYRYSGLPPGPICNPSYAALFAVAHPLDTPYYFFRAKCDDSGLHNFAITFEEHLANGCP